MRTTSIETLAGTSCPAQIPTIRIDIHPTSGRCLESLARYMHETDLRPTLPATRRLSPTSSASAHDIASSAVLEDVAEAGGGTAYTQPVTRRGLAATLEEIFLQVQDAADTTFVAPPSRSTRSTARRISMSCSFRCLRRPGTSLGRQPQEIPHLQKRHLWCGRPHTGGRSSYGILRRQVPGLELARSADGPAASMGGAAHSLPNVRTRASLYLSRDVITT